MTRKLPSRIKFYRSPPHAGTLLANLSSSKPRSIRGGGDEVSRLLHLIDTLIAMAEDTNNVASIEFIALKAGTRDLGSRPEASDQRHRLSTGTDRILLTTPCVNGAGLGAWAPT